MKDTEKMDKIIDICTDLKIEVVQIKQDLAYHIRRTDILEDENKNTKKKLQYIIYMLIAGAAVTGAEMMPVLFAFLKGIM